MIQNLQVSVEYIFRPVLESGPRKGVFHAWRSSKKITPSSAGTWSQTSPSPAALLKYTHWIADFLETCPPGLEVVGMDKVSAGLLVDARETIASRSLHL